MKTFIWIILFAALFVLPYPVRSSGDSYFYAAAASSVGEGMRYPDHTVGRWMVAYPPGDYYVAWSPLYPLLLAGLQTGMPLGAAFKLINWFALAGILWVIYHQPHPLVVRWMVMLFACFALNGIVTRALSDVLFLSLCLLFLDRLEHGSDLRWLIPLAIAASLTKYVGVAVLATGILTLVYRRQWRTALLFSGLACLPLMLWITRNYALTGTLWGVRVPAVDPVGLTLQRYGLTVGHWIMQLSFYTGLAYALTTLFHRLHRRHFSQRLDRRLRQYRGFRRAIAHPPIGVGNSGHTQTG